MVSVVILTTGQAVSVLDCLKRQTYKEFEIILATEKGIVNAMNKALDRAKGDIFVRIDDDVALPPQWLDVLVGQFLHDNVGGVTGPTFVPTMFRKNRDSIRMWEHPNRFFRWLMDNRGFAPAAIYKCGSVSYDSNYQERFYWRSNKPFEVDHLEGTNWAMRTELIRRVGGFDPKFDGVAEWFDTDVEAKVKKLGYRLIYNPDAYLYHLLGKSEHYSDRFQGVGRIKNWLRYHWRHSKFHPKMIVFLFVWILYFIRAWAERLWKRSA